MSLCCCPLNINHLEDELTTSWGLPLKGMFGEISKIKALVSYRIECTGRKLNRRTCRFPENHVILQCVSLNQGQQKQQIRITIICKVSDPTGFRLIYERAYLTLACSMKKQLAAASRTNLLYHLQRTNFADKPGQAKPSPGGWFLEA